MLPSEIESERQAMWRARQSGKEGRARVCARRAAGKALRLRYGAGREPGNAYTWLQWASGASELPEAVRRAAQHLAARVLPGGRPAYDDDPLADAELILRLYAPASGPEGAG